MPKVAPSLIIVLIASLFVGGNAYGFLGGDLAPQNSYSFDSFNIGQNSEILKTDSLVTFKKNILPTEKTSLNPTEILVIEPIINSNQNTVKRYLIFGSGSIDNVDKTSNSLLQGVTSQNGFFSVGVLSDNQVEKLQNQGYNIIQDVPLDFHSINNSNQTAENSKSGKIIEAKKNSKEIPEISKIQQIVQADKAFEKYNYTGRGINIAIVDTGVDFSNPDIQHALARDENNIPIMLDADGQGIVLTNTTFVANVDQNGVLRDYDETLPKNVDSSVYITKEGVFLDIKQGGNGTTLEIYNSFFPSAGFAPVFNGTLNDDMKIGQNNRDYIVSKSNTYHLGVMYQGTLQGPQTRIQVVPVLVVDSEIPGKYDTIIPDLSTSWKDFTRFDLESGETPNYDFDFTDEKPVKLGSGNEFLIYDSDDDGKYDYSVGTFGARVLDIYGVITNKTTTIDGKLRAINGTLLPPLDPDGEFFGVMTDSLGHGTASSASIVSKGIQEYDIYNNTKKYKIKGVAPGAKIIPIKALWFGDTVYAWLWAAGFENTEDEWKFTGQPKANIVSNSWGISNFPNFKSGPGLDILSLILSVLVVPQSIDSNYPGVTMVTSAGNSGHGYGTMGLPNSSPYGISVGATTNNVFVGYGTFKDQPRFGNTTDNYNHVVDFSSRGPGLVGDPKPDLMSIGAYSFTPKSITKMKKDSKDEPFSLFGGTSMAAPIVSGSAAILMESMYDKSQRIDPLRIKNILMSTATDLKNDPFTQGSGLVNVYDAVNFVNGEEGVFIVHNSDSFSNIKQVLDVPLSNINSSKFGIDKFEITKKKLPTTSWFGGRLLPGERTTTTFTIENPTNEILDVKIKPQTLKLIKQIQFNETTAVQLQDSILNDSGTYRPNYVRLADVHKHDNLLSYFDNPNPIPNDASLMILNLNFPFDQFMNKTETTYANDIKISSLYLYDWVDKNNDTKILSDELSLVNRGGSWGTIQELRVTNPNENFEETPVVGIYPVPSRYSYWLGETQKNSTSMNYTLTASYYKKDTWNPIWLDNNQIQIQPKSSAKVSATMVVPTNYQAGIYQGFLSFDTQQHSLNVPVSFGVKKLINKKDTTVLIPGSKNGDVLYGNGYVKGAFDMVNRYMSGDWKQYYFDIADETINGGAFDISWESEDSSVSVFVIDPQGRIVQTNVPPGVFGHFMNWPSNDWLGTTPFSQGGGFFPVKNKDQTSTVLYTPINQTGTYTLMIHSTLFGGESLTEPVSIAAKFSTILHDNKKPEIILDIPEFINKKYSLLPQIQDENLDSVKYFLDGKEINFTSNLAELDFLYDGTHKLEIFASDLVGLNTTETFVFHLDNSPPDLIVKSPRSGMTVSENLPINFEVNDENLLDKGGISIILPDGELITDTTSLQFDTSNLENGQYEIQFFANDKAENEVIKTVSFYVDHNIIDSEMPIIEEKESTDQNYLLVIGIIIGATIGVISVLLATNKIKISATG